MARRDEIDPEVLQRAARAKPALLPVASRRAFEAAVLESDMPVVVDFWAPWCAFCVSLSNALTALAPLYEGKLAFVKIDVSDPANKWAAAEFEITSIPLVLLFSNGQRVEDVDLLGQCTRKQLVHWLDDAVAPTPR